MGLGFFYPPIAHCPQPSHYKVVWGLTLTPPITHCPQPSHFLSPLNFLLPIAPNPHNPHSPSTSYCPMPPTLKSPSPFNHPLPTCPNLHNPFHHSTSHCLFPPTLTFPMTTQTICNTNNVNIINHICIFIILKIGIN